MWCIMIKKEICIIIKITRSTHYKKKIKWN
jgi:hypothetical protein